MIVITENLALKTLQSTPAEAQQLSEIATQAYRDHYLYLWEDEGKNYINTVFDPIFLQNDMRNSNHLYWLVYWQNRAEGFLKVKINAPLPNQSPALELERIYLTQAVAGQGIGQHLLDFVCQVAQNHQQKHVWLKVMDSSVAVRFYEKNGFVQFGTHHLDLPYLKDEYRGMYLMAKDLYSE
ncbi:MAG: GNAT family N-acetyltransferase [Microscillaceae bacterium]|jgi:ribosomal protein S18 acetylase RimI-like enzyme|nr:GNAT family N-acetyltransferase [Microscillaceae bacterium]